MRALFVLVICACVILLLAWQFVGMVREYERVGEEQRETIERHFRGLEGAHGPAPEGHETQIGWAGRPE